MFYKNNVLEGFSVARTLQSPHAKDKTELASSAPGRYECDRWVMHTTEVPRSMWKCCVISWFCSIVTSKYWSQKELRISQWFLIYLGQRPASDILLFKTMWVEQCVKSDATGHSSQHPTSSSVKIGRKNIHVGDERGNSHVREHFSTNENTP